MADAFVELCIRLSQGSLLVCASLWLVSTRLDPLIKPKKKVRPLGQGHALWRIAAKSLAKVFQKKPWT